MLITKPKFIGFIIALFFFAICAQGQVHEKESKSQLIRILGKFAASMPHTDTVTVRLWQDVLSSTKRYYTPSRIFHCPVVDGKFQIAIDSVNQPSYLSLSDSISRHGNPIEFMSLYLIEPTDDILIDIKWQKQLYPDYAQNALGDTICVNCKVLRFSGKGSAKYNARFAMDTVMRTAKGIYMAEALKKSKTATGIDSQKEIKIDKSTLLEESTRILKGISFELDAELDVLKNYKHLISPASYQIIKANAIGKHLAGYAGSMRVLASLGDALTGALEYQSWYNAKLSPLYKFPSQIAAKSIYFPEYLASKEELELMLDYNISGKGRHPGKKFLVEKVYRMLASKYTGELRDKIIVGYLLDGNSFLSDTSTILDDALNLIGREDYWSILNELKFEKQIGKEAYNFSLPDSTGKQVTLESFKGKVVFIDFWFNGCSGCAKYYQEIVSKVEEHFKDNDQIIFIAISIDESRKIWMQGVNSGLYTSSNVVNLYKAGSSPILKQFMVSGYPHPLLIDKQGKIFSNSFLDLRGKGTTGLINKINEALGTH